MAATLDFGPQTGEGPGLSAEEADVPMWGKRIGESDVFATSLGRHQIAPNTVEALPTFPKHG